MAIMTTPAHEQAELLSLAVHEFRTPVTVVAGTTDAGQGATRPAVGTAAECSSTWNSNAAGSVGY